MKKSVLLLLVSLCASIVGKAAETKVFWNVPSSRFIDVLDDILANVKSGAVSRSGDQFDFATASFVGYQVSSLDFEAGNGQDGSYRCNAVLTIVNASTGDKKTTTFTYWLYDKDAQGYFAGHCK